MSKNETNTPKIELPLPPLVKEDGTKPTNTITTDTRIFILEGPQELIESTAYQSLVVSTFGRSLAGTYKLNTNKVTVEDK